jgi:hypothetical protein
MITMIEKYANDFLPLFLFGALLRKSLQLSFRACILHCHPAHAFSAGTSAFLSTLTSKNTGSRAKSMRGMTMGSACVGRPAPTIVFTTFTKVSALLRRAFCAGGEGTGEEEKI